MAALAGGGRGGRPGAECLGYFRRLCGRCRRSLFGRLSGRSRRGCSRGGGLLGGALRHELCQVTLHLGQCGFGGIGGRTRRLLGGTDLRREPGSLILLGVQGRLGGGELSFTRRQLFFGGVDVADRRLLVLVVERRGFRRCGEHGGQLARRSVVHVRVHSYDRHGVMSDGVFPAGHGKSPVGDRQLGIDLSEVDGGLVELLGQLGQRLLLGRELSLDGVDLGLGGVDGRARRRGRPPRHRGGDGGRRRHRPQDDHRRHEKGRPAGDSLRRDATKQTSHSSHFDHSSQGCFEAEGPGAHLAIP